MRAGNLRYNKSAQNAGECANQSLHDTRMVITAVLQYVGNHSFLIAILPVSPIHCTVLVVASHLNQANTHTHISFGVGRNRQPFTLGLPHRDVFTNRAPTYTCDTRISRT